MEGAAPTSAPPQGAPSGGPPGQPPASSPPQGPQQVQFVRGPQGQITHAVLPNGAVMQPPPQQQAQLAVNPEHEARMARIEAALERLSRPRRRRVVRDHNNQIVGVEEE